MSVPFRSVFGQLLQIVPRDAFDALVRKHRHDAHAKGYPSHTQFVAMLFMQLGQVNSLHEIESRLGSIPDPFNFLGRSDAPARCNLAAGTHNASGNCTKRCFTSC